jgi:uridine kinase
LPTSPVLVGIAGGSGSGKTTLANAILDQLGRKSAALIPCDAYYRDQSHISPDKRGRINFDHPTCIQFDLLIEHTRKLRGGQFIVRPVYDFAHHTRASHGVRVDPHRVLLIEGNLIFREKALRRLFDFKIFVDASSDIRFIRRLQRDISERGRTTESVIRQYLATVRPMHIKFVEPTRQSADVVITNDGPSQLHVGPIVRHIRSLLERDGIGARQTISKHVK